MTIRDKLKALTAPCREADAEIAVMFGWAKDKPCDQWKDSLAIWSYGGKWYRDPPRFTASLDATVALVEREMPGKNWSVVRYENRTTIACLGEGDRVIADGRHTFPAVALQLALLDAKEIE